MVAKETRAERKRITKKERERKVKRGVARRAEDAVEIN